MKYNMKYDDSGSDYLPDDEDSESDDESDDDDDDDDDWKMPLAANHNAARKRPYLKTEDKDIEESKDVTSVSGKNSQTSVANKSFVCKTKCGKR